jgi:FkbM family methyltransferase
MGQSRQRAGGIRHWLRERLPWVKRSPANQFEAEAAEWAFYLSYLREGMTVFDIGAFVGELTLVFARFVREQGMVHTFEPSPATFERLQTICQLSGYHNVKLNRIALAASAGEVEFHIYEGEYQSWNTLARRPLEQHGIHMKPVLQRVPASTVDAYCQQHQIGRIDLLKIDVEGAEFQVLQGARQMLSQRRIQCCAFEFGQTTLDMGNRPEAIQDYLGALGYQVRNLVRGDPVFPRDSRSQGRFSMHLATLR